MSIAVSIIIPAFNRVTPLVETLQSVRIACANLEDQAEILLVDDGSMPPLIDQLPGIATDPLVKVLRQKNAGSIIARLTGLAEARGEFVLFLDSDDLIAPTKLCLHVQRLREGMAVATYDDVGAYISNAGSSPVIETRQTLPATSELNELMLRIQPLPHGCIFRRDFLQRALAQPVIKPHRSIDAVGDIWLFYNLSVFNETVAKIDAPLSLIGIHDQERYSQNWERLGCESLRLVEKFMQATAGNTARAVQQARQIAGEVAFKSWRQLPRKFSPEFQKRILKIWQQASRGHNARLGGPFFQALARFFGPVGAGRLLRLRNMPYSRCRTVDDDALGRLLNP
jgi:hypothetical protein